MTTLTLTRPSVKPARRSRRPFGYGVPAVTAADRAWAAQHLNDGSAFSCLANESCPPTGLTSAQLDAMAEVSAAVDRMSDGFPAC